jgi:HEPN/RES N-terminal domain 1/RES domain
VSLSKRLWEEEQDRGYHTSDDAVCPQCFSDAGLKAFIEDHLEANTCTVCGTTADHAIAAPADDVLAFFLEKVGDHYQIADGNAPYDNEEGRYFVNTWDMYDLVFDELQEIGDYSTLEWLYKHLKDDGEYCERDWQILSPGEALMSAWDRFCAVIKHETRFLFFAETDDEEDEDREPFRVRPAEMLEELGKVILECGLIQDIKTGTRLFRVRGHEANSAFTKVVDLGPPPKNNAKSAGRMNAPGIVVMYGAFDRDTALAEATGAHNDFSVAEFELLKGFRVVDLTRVPPVPSIFEKGPRESLRFLRHFAKDVSQPFTPDKELHIEYTPTQVVSEYLRHRLRDKQGRPILGLLYKSTKREGGVNLALFIESEEVEGAPSDRWKSKKHRLRMVGVEEVSQK